jgi:hypothetical protein
MVTFEIFADSAFLCEGEAEPPRKHDVLAEGFALSAPACNVETPRAPDTVGLRTELELAPLVTRFRQERTESAARIAGKRRTANK